MAESVAARPSCIAMARDGRGSVEQLDPLARASVRVGWDLWLGSSVLSVPIGFWPRLRVGAAGSGVAGGSDSIVSSRFTSWLWSMAMARSLKPSRRISSSSVPEAADCSSVHGASSEPGAWLSCNPDQPLVAFELSDS